MTIESIIKSIFGDPSEKKVKVKLIILITLILTPQLTFALVCGPMQPKQGFKEKYINLFTGQCTDVKLPTIKATDNRESRYVKGMGGVYFVKLGGCGYSCQTYIKLDNLKGSDVLNIVNFHGDEYLLTKKGLYYLGEKIADGNSKITEFINSYWGYIIKYGNKLYLDGKVIEFENMVDLNSLEFVNDETLTRTDKNYHKIYKDKNYTYILSEMKTKDFQPELKGYFLNRLFGSDIDNTKILYNGHYWNILNGEHNFEDAKKECSNLGDYWRLPTIDELCPGFKEDKYGITSSCNNKDIINSLFNWPDSYWSSTQSIADNMEYLVIGSNSVSGIRKKGNLNVICIYDENYDGNYDEKKIFYTYKYNGKDYKNLAGGTYTWEEAKEACNNLGIGWDIPDIYELCLGWDGKSSLSENGKGCSNYIELKNTLNLVEDRSYWSYHNDRIRYISMDSGTTSYDNIPPLRRMGSTYNHPTICVYNN